jgi:hypothetical protein
LSLVGDISRADIPINDRDKIAGLYIQTHTVEINHVKGPGKGTRSFVIIRDRFGNITDWAWLKEVSFSLKNEMFWKISRRVYRVRFDRLTVSRTNYDVEIAERSKLPRKYRVSVFTKRKAP